MLLLCFSSLPCILQYLLSFAKRIISNLRQLLLCANLDILLLAQSLSIFADLIFDLLHSTDYILDAGETGFDLVLTIHQMNRIRMSLSTFSSLNASTMIWTSSGGLLERNAPHSSGYERPSKRAIGSSALTRRCSRSRAQMNGERSFPITHLN